jgi:hypothetical protein
VPPAVELLPGPDLGGKNVSAPGGLQSFLNPDQPLLLMNGPRDSFGHPGSMYSPGNSMRRTLLEYLKMHGPNPAEQKLMAELLRRSQEGPKLMGVYRELNMFLLNRNRVPEQTLESKIMEIGEALHE